MDGIFPVWCSKPCSDQFKLLGSANSLLISNFPFYASHTRPSGFALFWSSFITLQTLHLILGSTVPVELFILRHILGRAPSDSLEIMIGLTATPWSNLACLSYVQAYWSFSACSRSCSKKNTIPSQKSRWVFADTSNCLSVNISTLQQPLRPMSSVHRTLRKSRPNQSVITAASINYMGEKPSGKMICHTIQKTFSLLFYRRARSSLCYIT